MPEYPTELGIWPGGFGPGGGGGPYPWLLLVHCPVAFVAFVAFPYADAA